MIRNPWPNKIKLPDNKDWCYRKRRGMNEIRRVFCKYNLRHTMICMVDKDSKVCKDCYWRQQSMGMHQMLMEKIYIDRYCDRCGSPIENPDTPMYLELQDKMGRLVINMEICRGCAAEIADWVGGAEMPPATEVDASIWD